MKFYFKSNGKELEAHLGDKAPFYADVMENGKSIRKGFTKMLAAGWILTEETGKKIDDIDVAWAINRKIKQHQEKKQN